MVQCIYLRSLLEDTFIVSIFFMRAPLFPLQVFFDVFSIRIFGELGNRDLFVKFGIEESDRRKNHDLLSAFLIFDCDLTLYLSAKLHA